MGNLVDITPNFFIIFNLSSSRQGFTPDTGPGEEGGGGRVLECEYSNNFLECETTDGAAWTSGFRS